MIAMGLKDLGQTTVFWIFNSVSANCSDCVKFFS